jgi:hypothetical protein
MQTDVVEEHHRRNRLPRAPDPEHLRDIRERQHSGNFLRPLVQDTQFDEEPYTLHTDTEGPVADAVEGLSVPPGELTGAATKLRSYPYKFREIIERAKQFAQCGAATDPFPSRAWFVDEKSLEYVAEAIAEREEQGVFVPSGTSSIASANQSLADDPQDTGHTTARSLACS